MQTELNYDIVFDAQQHFRLLLDSMSRPGKINTFPQADILPPASLNQAAALTGFALLNADVAYFIAGGDHDQIAAYLLVNTGSQEAGIADAEYIFLPEGYFTTELSRAQTGTAMYPEDSASLIASARLVSERPHEGAVAITLQGPGVNGEARVYVSGIDPALLHFLTEQNAEYPLGLDLVIADRENHIICIPRSNKFTFTQPE